MTYEHHNTYQSKLERHAQQPDSTALSAAIPATLQSHKQRVWNELKSLGMSVWGFYRLETRYLPSLIHINEPIKAVAYGHNSMGSAMIVATDRRIIFVDRKPLFTEADEVSYDVVSGVSYARVWQRATVTLHTRMGDFTIHTSNIKCAEHFRDYVETYCLEHPPPSYNPIQS